MKTPYIIITILYAGLITSNAQDHVRVLQDALPKMKNSEYKGTFTNDSLVAQFISEYLFEAENHGLDLREHIDNINWVLIEPESNQPPKLTGMILAKIDKDRQLILLSRLCLIDRNIIHVILFRELSHYLGVPYNLNEVPIMSLERPKGYSYGWIDDPWIREIEYKQLFEALKLYLN